MQTFHYRFNKCTNKDTARCCIALQQFFLIFDFPGSSEILFSPQFHNLSFFSCQMKGIKGENFFLFDLNGATNPVSWEVNGNEQGCNSFNISHDLNDKMIWIASLSIMEILIFFQKTKKQTIPLLTTSLSLLFFLNSILGRKRNSKFWPFLFFSPRFCQSH